MRICNVGRQTRAEGTYRHVLNSNDIVETQCETKTPSDPNTDTPSCPFKSFLNY